MCGSCHDHDYRDEKGVLSSPTRKRGCTDMLALFVFFLFWAGMIFIAAFSITKGDAFRLAYGYDSYGNTCDEDNTDKAIPNIEHSGLNLKGKSYVFFMDVEHPKESMRICVNKCPHEDLDDLRQVAHFSKTTGSHLCRYDVTKDDYENLQGPQGLQGPCPMTPVKKSVPLLNRCVPSPLSTLPQEVLGNIINFLNSSDTFHKVLSDLYNTWKEMIVLCFVAFFFALIMALLIRFFASVIVWLILGVVIIASLAGTAFLWWTYASVKNKLDNDFKLKIPLLDVEISSENTFLTFSIIASVLTVILLLVILVMRKRISLVVALFHEAGKCISSMPCLLAQPIWTFFILLIFFVYWVIVLIYLATAEKVSINKSTKFVEYIEHENVSYFWWYHAIGLVWTGEFIIACQQLVISGAVATWYFTRDKESIKCAICVSIGRLVIYHLGSVALGSLVITLIKMPRMILMYLNKKLKTSENSCAQFCMKCCICCLWCVEKCLKYLNANAYTLVAISGKNFCKSAKRAFIILVSNSLRVAAINSIGDFMLFLGKLGVMGATAAVGIMWLKSRTDLHFFAIPVLLVCVFAYFVAHSFLTVYEMVIDALLLCFCEDCDMNDGSPERPFFASKDLMVYIQDSSKALNELTKRKGSDEMEPAEV
ncbi:choline transporter-like protein 1 [Haliotis rufescens]|uniref:choline transporter-like protein 1 n=1 Tax=Haliotis rufescens TaxID=6454 RepID=UPI001EAFFB36|nr:choline transporter-like protein 1 [Haliotis rufescens]XP_046365313.1 choline transporter-like protein 1 [Haliotis rufescens]XP_046365322.1 choline transporter-like protein 1 [Haliotis rufescens]XP_046365331.1 choline transporter-like protein 1 [Haliotis rufescens]XP_046365338.1 choline transporter-like protein 1 [Haliotis rufescens]XP_046365345.1 choline transporter-like protein 1 [Haliotis rufescens]XP_046365353.1 choline transporter-like protein 1 [Haliotis rufescens]XP_048256175.1 cho